MWGLAGGPTPWFSQCESREAKRSPAAIKNSPSINDECQAQRAVWLGKDTSAPGGFMAMAGQGTWGTEDKDRQEDVRRPRCKCHLLPLNTSWNVVVDIQDAVAAVAS